MEKTTGRNEDTVTSKVRDADLLLQILDMLATPIFVRDNENKFVFSNKAHSALVGIPASELMGKSDMDFYSAEDAAMFMARDKIVMDSGVLDELEEASTSPNGRKMTCLTRKSKVSGRDGSAYLIGTNTDLTELRRREEQYRALAQTVPVGVWQIDETGETSFANPRFMAHIGIATDQFQATDIGSLLGANQPGFPGESCRFETELNAGPETRRLLVISSGWLQLGNSELRSAIVSTVDISEMTELKRINDEISRLNRELAGNMRKLSEAQDEIMRRGRMAQLGQLTATVAHEIRNPLGAVRTAAFLIERKVKDKGLGIETQLLRIANGITRCDAIITQLLDFSRSRALQCDTLVIDDWLHRLVEEEARALPAIVAIECEFSLGGMKVPIDAGQLNRAVINLLSNASEAMVGKGDDPTKFATAEPRIKVSTRATKRGVEIDVEDNGPGIASDILKKILEPLFTTKSFGTGLGLPAVEKVAQEHGGGLEVRSEPGKGAKFTLWFPVERQSREAA